MKKWWLHYHTETSPKFVRRVRPLFNLRGRQLLREVENDLPSIVKSRELDKPPMQIKPNYK